MKFKVNKDINITRPKSEHMYCSYCGESIRKGNYAVSIGKYLLKDRVTGHHSNSWVHIDCVNDMKDKIFDTYEKNRKYIIVEKLTE